MKTLLSALTLCLFCFTQSPAQSTIGRLALSPLQTLQQSIAKTDIKLTYSRPAMRGRTIFGDLVPYNKMWRTGANRNTKIEISQAVMIGDSLVNKGTYALFTKPTEKSWDIYLYDETTHWETTEPWEDTKVIAHIKVLSTRLKQTVQSMTFSLDNITNDAVDLSLTWENTKIVIPILLTTEKQMNTIIAKVMAGPSNGDYHLAALYKLQSNKDLEDALTWINNAIDMSPEAKCWDYALKAKIHNNLGQSDAAKTTAQLALKLAIERPSQYYIDKVTQFLERIE